jgi:molybdate transport system regulatory protein
MNILRGRITAVESNDHVSLVDVDVNGDQFTATLLETPEDAPYLQAGNQVDVMFKETEVSLAKGLAGMISLRNRMMTTVREVRGGVILSEVILDYRGQTISSIITSRSIKRLEIRPGDQVEALVKANEVTLLEIAT